MGNVSSSISNDKKSETKTTFGQVIDYIATYYILTMDFQSLRKLYEKEYCDNLVVLTSDIVDRYFSDLEISYLAQRIKNGAEINEMTKDNVIFFNKSDLEKLNISNSVKNRRVCIGIAKFYIKIAHVFAAIVTTINPVYVYKDEAGNVVKKKLFEKGDIPKHTKRKLYKMGICNNRINALKKGQELNTPDVANIHPKMCSANIGSDGETKTLGDEPGITELMDLYYDKYDYSSGNFVGMTEATQAQYNKDLKLFYQIFTGNEEMPASITKFSDIKLRDYNQVKGCQGPSAPFRTNVQLNNSTNEDPIKKKLFQDFAENTKQMFQSTNETQQELLAIINQLFTYVIDPQTKNKRIIVNPKLTEALLQEVVVKTRGIIIQLYLKCEHDFTRGVKLYQAIVEKQIKDTTLSQLKVLEETTDKLVNLETKYIQEIPSKETPMKQEATQELPSNEIPSKEIPSKEIPSKEISMKQEVPIQEINQESSQS